MTPENKCKVLPLLNGKASREQLINAVNVNTVCISEIAEILDTLTAIAEALQKRVVAAEEERAAKVEKYNDKYYCECGCPVEIMLDGITLKPIGGQIYCDQCGAKLDWSGIMELEEV